MSETVACPKCGQHTALQFFRTVGNKELCVLCAHRGDKADKESREMIEDRKLHGGLGWLWKHIVSVVVCLIAVQFLRAWIEDLFSRLFGGS